jgi:hypothetical protein
MHTNQITLSRAVGLLLAVLLIAVVAASCNDDDEASAEDLQEVEDIAKETVESDGSNAEFFFAHTTDNVIETVLFSTRDECQASAAECLGEPLAIQSLSATEIDGDTASTIAATEIGDFDVGLIREDGVWKVDSFIASSDEIPDGAAVVDLDLDDFAFVFDPGELPDDGNLAFRANNVGDQAHEVVVIGIPEGSTFEEALEAVGAEEVPPLAAKIFILPGQQVDMAFDPPLATGNYALVCFFPDVEDPEFMPHFEKGMFAEFAIE